MKQLIIGCTLLTLIAGCTSSNHEVTAYDQHRYQILVGKDLNDALKGIRSANYYVISQDQNNIVISVDVTTLVYSF
ncbi:hypothetical protein [Aliivibrio fischeri]|uniref:hypothetical protein n=1 Tax=Aliivibrio fischeri TaxID=668 RepID=UPI0007C51BFA|nr:hypothetical protein [Aliivibrio fischeri]